MSNRLSASHKSHRSFATVSVPDPRRPPVFAAGVDIEKVHVDGVTKYRVHNTMTDRVVMLGRRELVVAQAFDGRHSTKEVRELVRVRLGAAPSESSLEKLVSRLTAAGVLRQGSDETRGVRPGDPLTGFEARWFVRAFVLIIFRYQPNRWLNKLLEVCPWLSSWRASMGAAALAATGAVIVVRNMDMFLADLSAAATPIGLLVLIAALAVQSVFHEGAHALACKGYGVDVREVGFCFYFLVPMGWTRPDQLQWSALNKGQKIATAVVGPLGSMLFGAVGVALWQFDDLRSVGVLVAASAVGTLPTMNPMFAGDAYLVVSELWDRQGYRQAAFARVGRLLRGEGLDERTRLGLLLDVAFVGLACLSWAGLCGVALLVVLLMLRGGAL